MLTRQEKESWRVSFYRTLNENLGLLIMFQYVGMLTASNRRLSQKSLVTTFLLIVAICGMILFGGLSINLNIKNTQVQAQEQPHEKVGQTKSNKLWETPANLKNP